MHPLHTALILYPNIILRLPYAYLMHPLCIGLILYPNILRIPLCIAYASLMHSFDFILTHHLRHSVTHTAYAFLTHSVDFIPTHHLTHSLRIAYASLMHSLDFIPTHRLTHSLMHSLHISYA